MYVFLLIHQIISVLGKNVLFGRLSNVIFEFLDEVGNVFVADFIGELSDAYFLFIENGKGFFEPFFFEPFLFPVR